MAKFIGKRLLMAVVTLWVIITVTFFLMKAIPGNPFQKEGKMPAVVYENILAKYGLDRPVSEQYVIYMQNILRGDLGASMKSRVENVNDMITRGAPVSFQVGIQAFLVAVLIGPALGAIAALYQNRWPDYMAMILAIVGISVPSFILATFMIQFIAKNSAYFPIGGWGTFAHSILPSLSLAVMPLASMARLMRSSMLEILGQDYIKTAKSKGISQFAVIMKHAVRNAILPIISQMGTTISNLLVGSFVVEKIFGVPGIGRFFVDSVMNRDYTLIMGITIFYAVVLIAMLLIVDILYVLIDPRIKLTEGAK